MFLSNLRWLSFQIYRTIFHCFSSINVHKSFVVKSTERRLKRKIETRKTNSCTKRGVRGTNNQKITKTSKFVVISSKLWFIYSTVKVFFYLCDAKTISNAVEILLRLSTDSSIFPLQILVVCLSSSWISSISVLNV